MKRGIELRLTNAAMESLAADGFDPQYGARPLRRAIQHQLEDVLSEELLSGHINPSGVLTVDVENGKLCFRSASDGITNAMEV